tara:strand:+ start:5431 stop:6234 length:804 start_codon:yes stop_codon:yes gene_type:complete
MSVTLVTSLYDINRSNLDGRTWDEYLEWFAKTLQLKSPMVVFVDQDLVEFVQEHRKNLPTKIVEESIDQIPYYYLKEKMDVVIQSKEYQSKISDPNRIECKSSLYNIIQYSKFGWLEFAADENYFNSEYFLWVDAGLSRFFYDINLSNFYPGENAKESLLDIKDSILIQVFLSYYPDLANAKELSKDYLQDNRSYIMGGMFGAGKESIKKFRPIVDDILDQMLSDNLINNEQIALGYLYKKHPDLFVEFFNESHLHRSYELVVELSK